MYFLAAANIQTISNLTIIKMKLFLFIFYHFNNNKTSNQIKNLNERNQTKNIRLAAANIQLIFNSTTIYYTFFLSYLF
jgi:hypothetical protein